MTEAVISIFKVIMCHLCPTIWDEIDLFMRTMMMIMPANSFPTKLVVVRANVEQELSEILKPSQLLKSWSTWQGYHYSWRQWWRRWWLCRQIPPQLSCSCKSGAGTIGNIKNQASFSNDDQHGMDYDILMVNQMIMLFVEKSTEDVDKTNQNDDHVLWKE